MLHYCYVTMLLTAVIITVTMLYKLLFVDYIRSPDIRAGIENSNFVRKKKHVEWVI